MRQAPEPEAPTATAPPAAAGTGLTPGPDHVDREVVVAGVSADPGAQEGPGPEIRIDTPWEGYDELDAQQVIATLADASPEKLAVVRLYEAANRNRETVLGEIDRRLSATSS